jgi:hypothetical protein
MFEDAIVYGILRSIVGMIIVEMLGPSTMIIPNVLKFV